MTVSYFIDSHVHLDSEDYKSDFSEMIQRALDSGVKKFISIGAGDNTDSAQNAVKLAQEYEFIFASVGIHPHDASNKDKINFDIIKKLAAEEKVVCIGETGLDYFKCLAKPEDQKEFFVRQVELAKQVKKPLSIHCRNAGEDCLKILRDNNAETVGGVFHCFGEDSEFAKKLLDLNFFISIPGIVTFKKSSSFRETVAKIPLTQILLETDGPFLAPEPFRGKRCESAFMIETAKIVAEVKEISLEELAKVTNENCKKLFGI